MARRFIKEFKPGEQIADQTFMINSRDLRTTTNGSLYIHAILADKSGQIPARIWQASEGQYKLMPEGGFIRVRGRTENYKGNLQFIIEGINAVKIEEIDVADFLPRTECDVDQMWTRVVAILGTVKDSDLLLLMKACVHDAELVERFKQAPAAISMHHAFLGGLLEHTRDLLELALVVTPRYPELSVDLVLCGLFLHDIGKTRELSYRTCFQYTDEGQLLGHIVQGVILIEEKAAEIQKSTGKPFPEEKKWALQHIVLSHHGQYEFGSPKLPAMPEAIAVHHLDNLDAKIRQYLRAIETDRNQEASWTAYQRAFETKIYKRDVVPDGN